MEAGQELLGKSFAEARAEAQNVVGGMIDGLREGGQNMLDQADAAASEGYEKASKTVKDNMIDPLGKTLKEHEPSEVFNTSKVEREIADAYARYRPKPPPRPEDDGKKKGAGSGNETSGSGSNGLGGGLAGANRMATNLIMGRTINEVIAQIAKDQLDVAEDMVEEQKKTNAKLESMNKQTTTSTFQ